jgi:hypothetical protein
VGQPQPAQLEHLVGAGGDDVVDVPAQPALEVDPGRRGRVRGSLVTALDRAEGVEGLQHRRGQIRGGLDGGQPAHPEVRVHDVGRRGGPLLAEHPGELGHVREQLVLRQLPWRTGGDVRHVVAVLGDHPLGQRLVVPAGVHGDLVAPLRQARGEGGDVHVLPTGVHPADRGQGAGVLADQLDPHRVTSVSSASQSRRKRVSP